MLDSRILGEVYTQLCEVYDPMGAEIWLHGRNRSLHGRRPIDLLSEASYDEVLNAIERLQVGAM